MRNNNMMKKTGIKAIGLLTAVLVSFNGTGISTVLAEEKDFDESYDDTYDDEDDYWESDDFDESYDDTFDDEDDYLESDDLPDVNAADEEWYEDDEEDAAFRFDTEGGMAVFDASNEDYLREIDEEDEELDEEEYLSFYVNVRNTGSVDWNELPAYFRVDGKKEIPLDNVSLGVGEEGKLHIGLEDFDSLDPGLHEIEVYINDEMIYTSRFYKERDWDEIMADPTDAQKAEASNTGRSPYVVYYPQFEDVSGITDYSIDFSIDETSKGTYFSTLTAYVDTAELEQNGLKLQENYGDPACLYCGFQQTENGKASIIMSIWDVSGKDEQGNSCTYSAKPLFSYDKNAIKSITDGEGSYQQFLMEYPWKAQHPYRMTMQLGKNEANGNATLTMQICDLTTQEWTKLVTWDLGYSSQNIKTKNLSGFLENYLVQYNGDRRSANFSNIRARDAKDQEWKAVDTVKFTVNNSQDEFDYVGSYKFGADDNSFWAVTSGVKDLCESSKSESEYTVKNASADSPY